MAVDSIGPKGNPLYDDNLGFDLGADMVALSTYAAMVGNRIADVAANRTGFAAHFGFNPIGGLQYYETDTGSTYDFDGANWILRFQPWKAFSPGFTNLNVGGSGATVGGEYQIREGYASIVGRQTLGAGASASGTITMTMPVTRRPGFTQPRGTFFAVDASNKRYPLGATLASPTSIALDTVPISGSYATPVSNTSASSPLIWQSGVQLWWDYEIAFTF